MKRVRSTSGVGPSFGGLSYIFCVIMHCMFKEQLKGWNLHGVVIISVNFYILRCRLPSPFKNRGIEFGLSPGASLH